MVDIGGDDGAAAGDLVAHKFRRHKFGHRRAKALPIRMADMGVVQRLGATEIFALGGIDHLIGDDARFRELILGHGR